MLTPLTNDKNQTLKHILFNDIPGRDHLLLTVKLTGVEQRGSIQADGLQYIKLYKIRVPRISLHVLVNYDTQSVSNPFLY